MRNIELVVVYIWVLKGNQMGKVWRREWWKSRLNNWLVVSLSSRKVPEIQMPNFLLSTKQILYSCLKECTLIIGRNLIVGQLKAAGIAKRGSPVKSKVNHWSCCVGSTEHFFDSERCLNSEHQYIMFYFFFKHSYGISGISLVDQW